VRSHGPVTRIVSKVVMTGSALEESCQAIAEAACVKNLAHVRKLCIYLARVAPSVQSAE
jgi:hypothetical protein